VEITIQELHKYNLLVETGTVPPIPCPINPEHMRTLPWVDEDDKVCQKCFACNSKVFLGQKNIGVIKLLITKGKV
jgi:hypothetical protein